VTSEFEHAWVSAVGVPGWLTQDQALSLWNAAMRVAPDATIVEIGSHQGRSTVVLAKAAVLTGARVVAIDPFIDGVLFGGATTQLRFEKNIAAAGVSDVVELIVERSTVLRPSWDRPVAMVYVDGKHDFWTARDDLRWAERLPAGAPLLLHDAFSSIGVTLAVVLHVLPGQQLRYLGRAGSLARFEAGPPSRGDRLRILGELPWFARNVTIKIVLRVLRIFGYRRPDPY
jgi:hypothetical protein